MRRFPVPGKLARTLPLLALISSCCAISATLAQTEAGAPAPAQYPAATQPTQLPPTNQPAQQVAQAEAVGAPLAQVASLPQQAGTPGVAPAQRGLIGPPFQITPVEQQFVDQILQMWENESSKINTFNSRFERWEYDLVFGPGSDIPFVKSVGQLTYSKPDKGSFKIEEISRWTKQDPSQEGWKPGDWVLQKEEVGEHWVCDGKAVFEYKHDKKQLVVQPLPPDLQGKEIVNGPLPFLFGAKADELNRRYWIRSKQGNPTEIWLEAYPRTQADAANYHHVEIMLDRKSMQPKAIQVHSPNNQNRAVYMFDKPTINGRLNALLGSFFSAPRTPLGWTRVVQPLPTQPQPGSQAVKPQPTAQR